MAIRTRSSSSRRDPLALVVAHGAEAPGEAGRVCRVAGDAGKSLDAARLQLLAKVAHRVGELGEDEDLLVGVLLEQQVAERLQLGVLAGVPVAALRAAP